MAERDGEPATEPGTDDDGGSAADGLSDAAREWVRRNVAEMGPLSREDREYLAYMFHRRD
ncbi:hypothetical protein ACQP1W_38780 [Spirillospora sp. CA-255316]